MNKKILVLVGMFLLGYVPVISQIDSLPPLKQDSLPKPPKREGSKKASKKISIANYKIISHDRDTVLLDTSLTIQKEYAYNYLRKDDFELMPFSNIGQPYNTLGANFREYDFYPKLGARARHFGFFEAEDITYYNMATPMTELFFKTTLEQGQLLDAKLAFNTSERLNFSLAYIGFRSLGKYDFDQAQSGRFRATFNYETLNKRYQIRGHYAGQELDGEENGGLLNKELQFESGDPDFFDRPRVDVVFSNARNRILSKRYYIDHRYYLLRATNDSLRSRNTTISLGHRFDYETKFYQFTQSTVSDRFGSEVFDSPINDRVYLRAMFNQVDATFTNEKLGRLSGSLGLYDYDYAFNSLLILPSGTIPNQIKGNEMAIGGDYANSIGPLELKGKFRYNLSGDLSGTLIDVSAKLRLHEKHSLFGSLYGSSRLPDFNFLLYQSDYTDFNWFNLGNFDNQRVQTIAAGFDSKIFGRLEVALSNLENFTYFKEDGDLVAAAQAELQDGETLDEQLLSFVRPFQEQSTITHLKVKYEKELKWKKWALNNTIMYQEVSQDASILNVPELVTRNTLYFSSDVFKKAMYVQTGVTFKYFTEYFMNGYHPLLAEFYTQTREELGGYPLIDVFINARVRQTRIYFKAEHLNTVWDRQYNYYSAPNYPYRDFVIRFGLVWNFFS